MPQVQQGDTVKVTWDPKGTVFRVHAIEPDGGVVVYNARGSRGVFFPGEVVVVSKKGALAVGDRVRFPGGFMTYEVIDTMPDVGGFVIRTEESFARRHGESETRSVSADEVELLPNRPPRLRGVPTRRKHRHGVYTYGVLPPRSTFNTAFNGAVRHGGKFEMELTGRDAAAAEWEWGAPEHYTAQGKAFYSFTAAELYRFLENLTANQGDLDAPSLSLASAILSTLGFEWV